MLMHCITIPYYLARWESWLIRYTVTVEITGSSPVRVAIKNLQLEVNLWKEILIRKPPRQNVFFVITTKLNVEKTRNAMCIKNSRKNIRVKNAKANYFYNYLPISLRKSIVNLMWARCLLGRPEPTVQRASIAMMYRRTNSCVMNMGS